MTRHFPWLCYSRLLCAALTLIGGLALPAAAQMPASDYDAVVLQARVLDNRGHPVAGLPLRFTADLRGVALREDGQGEGVLATATRTATTDAQGLAVCRVSGRAWTREAAWFRGRVTQTVSLPRDPAREIAPLDAVAPTETRPVPADGPRDVMTLRVYEEPTQTVQGFPLWAAGSGHLDRRGRRAGRV